MKNAIISYRKTKENIGQRVRIWLNLKNQAWDFFQVLRNSNINQKSFHYCCFLSTFKFDGGEQSIIVGKWAYALGLANWHWGRETLLTCNVRYTDNTSIHDIRHDIEPDLILFRQGYEHVVVNETQPIAYTLNVQPISTTFVVVLLLFCCCFVVKIK